MSSTLRNLLSCLFALLPALVSAQNLLINGDFDADLTGWTPNGGGTSTFDASSGSPSVGSTLLSINDPSGNGVTQAVQQCVAAAGGVDYTIAGRGLIDTVNSTSAGAGTFIIGQFFASSDCSGSPSSTIANNTGTAAGTPADFNTYSSTLISPVSARSFRLTAQVQTGGPGIAQGWVDHLELTSTEVIFVNSFE